MSSLTSGNAGFIFEESNALEQLRDATSETVAVHVRAGRSRICVKELPSRNAIRYIAGVGIAEGIHTGSAGKVLLAYMPEAERERLLEDLPLPALTSTTITDVEALRTELRRVAAAGVAVSFGERVAGAVGVSAPITNRAGVALAALSVLGPADRLNRDRLPDIETRVRSVAKEISSTINAGAA
jgi:IclR family acetate operon transcriptional repressor